MFKNKRTNISAIARNLNIKAHDPIKFKEDLTCFQINKYWK